MIRKEIVRKKNGNQRCGSNPIDKKRTTVRMQVELKAEQKRLE
jgi:hypothetical protein